MHGDSLFWGEHFSFGNVEVFNMITVRMYKDTEKKRKGPTLVGEKRGIGFELWSSASILTLIDSSACVFFLQGKC